MYEPYDFDRLMAVDDLRRRHDRLKIRRSRRRRTLEKATHKTARRAKKAAR
jgi:hypothetical protein